MVEFKLYIKGNNPAIKKKCAHIVRGPSKRDDTQALGLEVLT